jgi:hypothetical protein
MLIALRTEGRGRLARWAWRPLQVSVGSLCLCALKPAIDYVLGVLALFFEPGCGMRQSKLIACRSSVL